MQQKIFVITYYYDECLKHIRSTESVNNSKEKKLTLKSESQYYIYIVVCI